MYRTKSDAVWEDDIHKIYVSYTVVELVSSLTALPTIYSYVVYIHLNGKVIMNNKSL